MSYTALYRKFRPQTFAEVRGQDVIVTTLTNQLRADRIGHAYLFCGTRGTGKTTIAKILARAVNCERPTEAGPCNACASCRAILAGTSTNVIEIDAASNNGVDNVRELREEVAYRPTEGRFKVYIIDEVHMMTKEAFNALLKTLEEPPPYVIFILATTEMRKIPATILSRCQRYDFRRISSEVIAGRMEELLPREGARAEEAAIRFIARTADGSMRDALSLLDQCIAACPEGELLTYEQTLRVLGAVDTEVFGTLLGFIARSDASGCIRTLAALINEGKELGQITSDFIWYLRDLLLLASAEDAQSAIDVSQETRQLMQQSLKDVQAESLLRYIRVLSELYGQLRTATQKRVLVETTLIRLCRPEMNTNKEALLARIRKLEAAVEAGVPVRSGSGGQSEAVRAVGATLQARADSDLPEGPEEAEPPAPEALPEDLKAICGSWQYIVNKIDNQLIRGFLQKSVPHYDANSEEARLFLSFPNATAFSYFRENPSHFEALQKLVQERTGKTVQFELLTNDVERPANLTVLPIDARVKEKINMDIEVEEDFD